MHFGSCGHFFLIASLKVGNLFLVLLVYFFIDPIQLAIQLIESPDFAFLGFYLIFLLLDFVLQLAQVFRDKVLLVSFFGFSL